MTLAQVQFIYLVTNFIFNGFLIDFSIVTLNLTHFRISCKIETNFLFDFNQLFIIGAKLK